MSLDDLRAQSHALAKDIHELDVDRHAAELSFANRLEILSTRANDLSVALQNYDPVPIPPVPTAPPVTYGRLIYNDPDISPKWTFQVLQGQPETVNRVPQLRAAGVKQLLRYTHAMTRTPNDKGVRQAYGYWTDSWLAKDRSGNPIVSTKFRSGPNGQDPNMLIDVGLPEYQAESARYLLNKCMNEKWDGVYLDEIVQRQSYTGYSIPARYGTDEAFQQAVLSYVTYVANTLKQAGYTCHINLGSDYNAWARAVTAACSGQHVEYFIAQRSLGSLASGAEWTRQVDWLMWNEQRPRQSICQADARTAGEVVYALATFLLATEGKGVFAAMNASQYGIGGAWWIPPMDTALKLGQPKGPSTVSNGLYMRDFEHGRVTVNPSLKPINTMPATSGLIELR